MDIVAVALALVIAVLIGFVVVAKRQESGYNPNAKDNDGDGLVQEGTIWERPEATVKIVPKKKAPAKKAATAKKAPAKKAPAKKTTAKKTAAKKK